MKKEIFESKFGFIEYTYEITDKYPNGLFIFMGSYIKKEFRNKGYFKIMIKELFSNFKIGTTIQLATINKNLEKFFLRLNFNIVDYIEYWNNTTNTVKMQGILTKELFQSI